MVSLLNNCPAPAKLNLFLHVTGRRPDGYHELQSVFQLLDYGDLLHFRVRNDNLIRRTTDLAGIPEQTDLIVRAARLLQTTTGVNHHLGADIAIEKKLPIGGGLGGGSSNAATTLIVLNHLWQTGLSRIELMELGLQLGADVPFFLFGENALAEGIGESLTPIQTPKCWYIVIEPNVFVPTRSIFSAVELTRDSKPVTITDFSMASFGLGRNDLEVVASKLFPPIAEAIKWLEAYGKPRMTGSGACVFCPCLEECEADQILKEVRDTGPKYWKAWKAKAIERHPLSHFI